jgi:hypothetical protein
MPAPAQAMVVVAATRQLASTVEVHADLAVVSAPRAERALVREGRQGSDIGRRRSDRRWHRGGFTSLSV